MVCPCTRFINKQVCQRSTASGYWITKKKKKKIKEWRFDETTGITDRFPGSLSISFLVRHEQRSLNKASSTQLMDKRYKWPESNVASYKEQAASGNKMKFVSAVNRFDRAMIYRSRCRISAGIAKDTRSIFSGIRSCLLENNYPRSIRRLMTRIFRRQRINERASSFNICV